MKKKNNSKLNVILLPLLLPWSRCADFQKQTINLLKEKNFCYIYLNGDKKRIFKIKKTKNLLLFYPIKNIFYMEIFNSFFDQLNKLIFKTLIKLISFKKNIDILWIFNSELNSFFDYFDNAKIKIYDLLDSAKIVDVQKSIDKADKVFANSHTLKKIAESVSDKKIILVPQGFDHETYKNESLVKIRKNKQTTITYIGSINFRMDFKLIEKVVLENPKCKFVFWGPIEYLDKNMDQAYRLNENIKKLKSYKNTEFGKSDRKELIKLLKKTSIGIIPYNTSIDFNRNCFPMKLMEYMFMGIPVLSTKIEELNFYSELATSSDNVDDWSKFIKKVNKDKWPLKKQELGRKIAKQHSWKNKIRAIENEINEPKLI